MATSGKSSVAALLLVVAVLAGACASASATDLPVKNGCKDLIVITTPVHAPISILPGATVIIDTGILVDPVYITINGKVYVIAAVDLSAILKVKLLVNLEIVCGGKCGHEALTINVYANVLGIVKLVLTVCVKLKV